MSNPTVLILPADGIGPEVMAEVRKMVDWYAEHRGIEFDISEDHVGGAAIDAHGTLLREETLQKALSVDAVLFGSIGDPKYDHLPFEQKPERSLLRLRKEMDLYANLRPARCLDALTEFSSLKSNVVAGLDLMIVRESTAGIYFSEPRGIFQEGGQRVRVNTHRYSESQIDRVARTAFELARQRNGKVFSMEKSNVMEAGAMA